MDTTKIYQNLTQLNTLTESCKIKVRITRSWTPKYPKTNQIICLNMLLVDDHGQAMLAIVRKKEMTQFNLQLIEGGVVELENFKVENTTGTHRVVNNECWIVFREDTIVTVLDGTHDNLVMHKFCFVDFNRLLNRLNIDLYLSDVIGRLCEMSRLQEFRKRDGTTTTKRDLKIENERGEKVVVTLWGEQALEMEDNVMENKMHPCVVLVITSTLVRKFGGDTNLWSSSATKIYYNLDMPEVGSMLGRFAGVPESDIRILERPANKQASMEEQMELNRKTLKEILADLKDDSNIGRTYTCRVRVVRVFEKIWSYLSCTHTPCRKRVFRQEFGPHFCRSCEKDVQNPVPRYKARMEVEDRSGLATVTVFDIYAEALIKYPCAELCDIASEGDGSERIARIFQKVIGTESIFQIKFSDYDIRSGNNVLTSTKVFPIVHHATTSTFVKGKERVGQSSEDCMEGNDVESGYENAEMHRSKKLCLHANPQGFMIL